jgi:hypothetical protein
MVTTISSAVGESIGSTTIDSAPAFASAGSTGLGTQYQFVFGSTKIGTRTG